MPKAVTVFLDGITWIFIYFLVGEFDSCQPTCEFTQWLNRRNKRHSDLVVCSPKAPERELEALQALSLLSVLLDTESTPLFSTVNLTALFLHWALAEKEKKKKSNQLTCIE
jgi:hypothetical protein